MVVFEAGHIIHIYKMKCGNCGRPIGGLAIDLDEYQQGEKALDAKIKELNVYEIKPICQVCIEDKVKHPLGTRDITELR